MKRLERLALLLTLLLAATAILLCATAETSGDFTYELRDDGTVEITGYTGSATNLSIPSTLNGHPVTGIGDWGLYFCSSLTNVILPDGVTRIGEGAFIGCDRLTTITIPDSVTQIGTNPFIWCTSLTRIIVSPNHPVLETIDGVLFNKTDGTLICYPAALTQSSYVLPDGATRIGEDAFSDCSFLESVSIPDSVTSIGAEAFKGCSSLASVNIPDGVTYIGSDTFTNCSSLKSITIPDSVTRIGTFAFQNCHSLTSIYIPNSVTEVGGNPFICCYALTRITVSSDHPTLEIMDGALIDKTEKRLICYPIGHTQSSFVVPDSVTSIGDCAFQDCVSLTRIAIPASVTSIGSFAFCGCSSLTSVTMFNTVEDVGYGLFDGCPDTLVISVS